MNKRKKALRKKLTTFFMLYFAFFTLYFSANTLSKYVGKISGEQTDVGIAKWEVSVNTDNTSNDIVLVAGNTVQEYKLNVISTSEIASKYYINISNIPNDIQVSLDGGEPQKPIENKVTFFDIGSFNTNETNSTHNHILRFEAPLEASVVENLEMQLDVVFIQDKL